MRYGYVFNEGEMCFILSWFGVHQSILHSWIYISVLLFSWQCSWGFSSVQSGKSRFLTSLIGNTKLLSTKCRGIRPHLAARWKSNEFSRVPAGTWCIFSSYGGDGQIWRESPRTLSQQEKNTDVTSGMQSRLVYPKLTQDEAHFPFIESIAVSHSTSYTRSGWTSFTTIQRFPETPISSL